MAKRKTGKFYKVFYKGKFILEGCSKDIEKALNLSRSAVASRRLKQVPEGENYVFEPIENPTEYVLYKGENFVDSGTRSEIMERHNMSMNRFNFLASPSWIAKKAKQKRDNAYALYVLDDDELDDENTIA